MRDASAAGTIAALGALGKVVFGSLVSLGHIPFKEKEKALRPFAVGEEDFGRLKSVDGPA